MHPHLATLAARLAHHGALPYNPSPLTVDAYMVLIVIVVLAVLVSIGKIITR
jgi:hypothetical protein